MSELDVSFELLSSMSPKVKKKKPKKSPHKLAVQNRIRRSSILDKSPHSHHVRDTTVIVINNSTLSDNLSPKQQIRIIKEPILISSSSESEIDESDEEEIDRVDEGPVVEDSKIFDINNWLSDNEKVDEHSVVYSFEHNSFSESDDDKLNVSRKLETKQKSPSGVWNVVSIESKTGEEPLRIKNSSDDEEIFSKPSIKFNIKDKQMTDLIEPNFEIDYQSEEARNLTANLLDDLYGKSWRKNEDEILMRSEPRKQIKPSSSSSRLLKTERKHKPQDSAWRQRLKNICDSDTSSEEDTTTNKKNINSHRKKLDFSDDSEDDSNFSADMTPPRSTRNTRNKKVLTENCSPSSSNNIDFNERDNDSLGTRVKKRLAKKAQTNNNLTKVTKNKTKLETNEKEVKKTSKVDNANKAEMTKMTKQQIDNFGYDERKYSFLKSLSGGIPPWQSDPDAQYFKTNYKTKKAVLAKKLFDLYNEKIFENCIPVETPLQWNDRMRGTAGYCFNKRVTKADGRVLRSCRIVLATKVLDTADRLRDTLVHEMCHAATWLVHNVSDGHGDYWKSWAHKALKAFPELPPIKRCHDYQINTKYTYKCVNCGYSVGRHSKSLDIERKRCGYCMGTFEVFINKVNKNGEKHVTPATPRGKTSAFALFVKENYNSVRSVNMKHAEVMRVLGKKFSEMKVIQNGK